MHTNLKINQVHILRAFACLGVLLNHATKTLWVGEEVFKSTHPVVQWDIHDYIVYGLSKIVTVEDQRVYFFFILSGFFLQYSVRESFSLSDYARKRLLRLYPAYLLSIVLSGVALFISFNLLDNAPVATSAPPRFTEFITNYYSYLTHYNFVRTSLFLATDNLFGGAYQLWSMPHEIIFCLLFPLYYHLKSHWRLALLLVLVALFCTTHNRYVHTQIFFLAGMAYYDIFSKGFTLPIKLPAACYYLTFGVLYASIQYFADPTHSHERVASVLTLLFSFLALDFFLHRKGTLPKPMKWLSQISYSVYLNHAWVLMLYCAVLSCFNSPVMFTGYFPLMSGTLLCLAVSYLFYSQVEKRIQAYAYGKQTAPADAPYVAAAA